MKPEDLSNYDPNEVEQAIDFLEEIAEELKDNKSPRAIDVVKKIKSKVIELRFKG